MLLAEWSGFRYSVGARDFLFSINPSRQALLSTQLLSLGTGAFSWVKRRGRDKREESYTSAPAQCLRGMLYGELYNRKVPRLFLLRYYQLQRAEFSGCFLHCYYVH